MAERIRIVAAGGGIADEIISPATRLRFNARIPFLAGGDLTEFWPCFDGWYINGGTNSEANLPAAISLTKVAFEINGVTIPVTFAGQRAKTIAVGAERQQGDTVLASAFGLAFIPRDTVIWCRLYGTAPSSTARLPNNCHCGTAGANFSIFASGTDRTDNTGILPAQTSEVVSAFGYGPTCILGRMQGKQYPSVIGFGSSTTAGTGDTNLNPAGGGILNRALVNWSGLCAIGGFACGVNSGAFLDEFIASSAKRREYFQFATHFLDQHHNSNVYPISGEVTKSRTVWGWARERGCANIIRVAYQPQTTSSDGWKTSANQAPEATASWSEEFFAAMAALVQSGEIQGLVTWNALRAGLPGTADWRKWQPSGNGEGARTGDGTHSVEFGYKTIGGEARALILGN